VKRLFLVLVAASLPWGAAQQWADEVLNAPTQTGGSVQASPTTFNGQTQKVPWIQEVWNGVGSAINTACKVVSGSTVNLNLNGVPVPIPVVLRPQPELEWVCAVAETWKTLNGIFSQDWVQLGADLVGTWIGDIATGYLTAMGIEAGTATWAQQIYDLNNALKQGYRDFMKKAYNLVWDSIKAELADLRAKRANPPRSMGGNLIQQWVNESTEEAKLVAPEGTRQALQKAESTKELKKLGVAAEAERQITNITKGDSAESPPRYMQPTNTIASKLSYYEGSATNPDGVLDDLRKEAQQAPDTRTAVEVVTKAVTEVVRANLYGDKAIVDALQMIIEGQLTTNRLLVAMLNDAGDEAYRIEQAYEDAILGTNAEAFAYTQTVRAGSGVATTLMNNIVPDFSGIDSF